MTQNLPKPSEIIEAMLQERKKHPYYQYSAIGYTMARQNCIIDYLDSQAAQLNNYFTCKEIHDSLPPKP